MTAPIPEFEQCPWPVDPACLTDEWETLDPEVQTRAIGLASATLHRLTGYRVGGCPVTVRPCKAGCATGYPSYYALTGTWISPHIGVNGSWINSCGCTTDCSCTSICEVVLPGPVGEVIEVRLLGGIVTPTQYRVDGNRLVWIGDGASEGGCPWPACQDMTADPTVMGTDTFAVTYLNSYPVDAIGAYAAGIMALEFARACTGSNKCRFPATVTAVSRQGVSFEVVSGSFPEGFTGIREVDAFIALWNPTPIRQQTQVWSPDLHQPRVVR
jgi:hypothetical protein